MVIIYYIDPHNLSLLVYMWTQTPSHYEALLLKLSVLLCFPDLKTVIEQLLDFIPSDRRLGRDLDRAPYQIIVESIRDQNDFIDSACDAISPEIKVPRGSLVTI